MPVLYGRVGRAAAQPVRRPPGQASCVVSAVLLPCEGCSTLVPVIGLDGIESAWGDDQLAVYCLGCAKRYRADAAQARGR